MKIYKLEYLIGHNVIYSDSIADNTFYSIQCVAKIYNKDTDIYTDNVLLDFFTDRCGLVWILDNHLFSIRKDYFDGNLKYGIGFGVLYL